MDQSGSGGCVYPFSKDLRDALGITCSSVAALSALFLVVSLIILSCRKLLGHYNFRLVLYQLLSSLLYSLVTVSQIIVVWYEKEGNAVARSCKAVGLGLTYSNWTVLLFKLYIVSELLYYAIVRDKRNQLVRTKRAEFLVVLSLFVLPAFVSWIPYTNDTFGYSGAWCWIRKKFDNCTDISPKDFEEEMGLWYGPLSLLMILLLVMICVTLGVLGHKYYKTTHCPERVPIAGNKNNPNNLMMLPLLGYPAIYILTHVVALADTVVGFILFQLDKGTSPLDLVLADAVTSAADGLLASIFFWIHLVLISVPKREPAPPPDVPTDNPFAMTESNRTSSNGSSVARSDEVKESEHGE